MNWVALEGFSNYEINEEGTVRNVYTGDLRKPSTTQTGAAKITLFENGVGHTRSLPLLVAKAHVYNNHDPEIFDTPIHLDNDPRNNRADNLMWRPRWFAVKYNQQYWKPNYRHATTRVEDLQTGVIYDGFVAPCQQFGLLYVDIVTSCNKGTYVFPTWKTFQFA